MPIIDVRTGPRRAAQGPKAETPSPGRSIRGGTESLENRHLLAVLTVGGSHLLQTIQSAVDALRRET